ncbi:unnamed protein product [Anisakis simplex]|uniref:PH domain-containing protein n=1 Tax=Anisakis simplex TaxID=6269 RepID=A0A0M3K8H0_ANISI|nr:unnamed protein product [Anisakis simplex]
MTSEMENSLSLSTGTKTSKSKKKEKKGILRSLSFQFSSSLNKRKQKVSEANNTADQNVQQTPPTSDYQAHEVDDKSMNHSNQGVQCYGHLLKQYKRRNRSACWNKRQMHTTSNAQYFRFFILKECFLIYYKASMKKVFEKTRRIGLHPKGIIPLVGCSIVPGQDHGHKHCLLITHSQFKAAIIVCANDAKTQDMWLKALREATNMSVSFNSLGQNLEVYALTMAM